MTRRHITTAITMLLLCGILVLGLVVGYKSLFSTSPSAGSTGTLGPACKTEKPHKGTRVKSKQVQVSVFNRGNRAGLAAQTLDALARRGFQRGQIGNAPSSAHVKNLQVWTTRKHDVTAKLVALQFGRAIRVHLHKLNLGPGIDVVVGNGYRGLVKAPRSLRVKPSQKVCIDASPSG
jgi:hypothetical protein